MSYQILTVSPQGNSSNDQYLYFSLLIETNANNRNNVTNLFINLTGTEIEINNALDTYINHGKIRSNEIDSWILFNNLHIYPKGNPRKLIFEFREENNHHYYTLYQPQGL
ncbi:MAG: hypothetical protein J0I09_01055 [Sphingobacteriia bacterium]|nr:hypothetical protein [Sphingobacteriia bacterium]